LGDGALFPFLSSQTPTEQHRSQLSIGFSVHLPKDLNLCADLVKQFSALNQSVKTIPHKNWLVLWADQPDPETGVFIRALGDVPTQIATYNTPLDDLLLQALIEQSNQVSADAPPMPVVEVP